MTRAEITELAQTVHQRTTVVIEKARIAALYTRDYELAHQDLCKAIRALECAHKTVPSAEE